MLGSGSAMCHSRTLRRLGYLPAKWEEKKHSVQHTLFHFNLSKKIEYEESGNCVLEIQQSPPLETGVDCNTAAGSPKPEVSSTLECFEEPDVANSVLPAELNSETRDLYNGCLEASIAGRKYHRDVECQAGMRVHLVREPENPMDTYAVKVLTADGLSLGHIPKELSRYLSPLMDKGVVDVQGYVSESTSEAARLKLDLREIQSRTIGSLSEEKVLAVKWSRLMDAADKGQDHGCRYQQNFLYILQVVLERDLHLFTPDEIELLEAFRSISSDGQRLFVRLAQRKGPWFRLQNIFYEDIGDTNSAVHELVERRYLVFDADVNSSELLEHLTVQELKDLAVNSKIMQVIIGFLYKREILGGSNLTALIREATGPCIRIAETVDVLLWRLQRLFFLNGEQEFHVFLLVDIGRIKHPSYRCARTMPVFASREDFLAYEQSKHPFLARFSAAWVYATICTVAASFLEKERRYAEAVNLFKQLLSMQYCPGRRGYWTLRLSIDLEHLQRLEESLLVAENGLSDFNVRGGDRIALQRRVLRLGKPPRRWKVPPYAALLKKKHKVHYGTSCSGVNWEKYSLEDLQTITVCIGGPGLSAICKLLAEDHSNWTAGMPDLLRGKAGGSQGSRGSLVRATGHHVLAFLASATRFSSHRTRNRMFREVENLDRLVKMPKVGICDSRMCIADEKFYEMVFFCVRTVEVYWESEEEAAGGITMLQGRESLIRVVGKRQRSVSLQDAPPAQVDRWFVLSRYLPAKWEEKLVPDVVQTHFRDCTIGLVHGFLSIQSEARLLNLLFKPYAMVELGNSSWKHSGRKTEEKGAKLVEAKGPGDCLSDLILLDARLACYA
ncbi:hypothetical protein SELMODRAFT_426715 [Selaginella moellendorffii]|uniref:Fanconi-associated nuclease n=1 Tax=Selaginella moellendorffii TaxID=88036 RepID=D8SX94_SELML|nr:hypothetical protein SELMODRAFT_426715 [Selaginella moellendorffii]